MRQRLTCTVCKHHFQAAFWVSGDSCKDEACKGELVQNPTTELYFEAHVTIDPVDPSELADLKRSAKALGFRVAEFIMAKGQKQKDTFLTGRDEDFLALRERMTGLIQSLRILGLTVRRYKIENTIVDSKCKVDKHGHPKGDVWRLLK